MYQMRVLLIAGMFLFFTQLPGFADNTSTAQGMNTPTLSSKTSADIADHYHTYVDTDTDTVDDGREPMDYGCYIDLSYEVSDSLDVGLKNSYEFQKKEFVSLAGVTLKFGGKNNDSWK